jgi:hypothetical protein
MCPQPDAAQAMVRALVRAPDQDNLVDTPQPECAGTEQRRRARDQESLNGPYHCRGLPRTCRQPLRPRAARIEARPTARAAADAAEALEKALAEELGMRDGDDEAA